MRCWKAFGPCPRSVQSPFRQSVACKRGIEGALLCAVFSSHSFAGGRTCCTDDDGASSVGLSDTVLGLVNAKEQRALQEAEERRFDAEIQTRLRDVTRLEALSPLGPAHGRVTGGAKMVVTGDPAIEFAVSCFVATS